MQLICYTHGYMPYRFSDYRINNFRFQDFFGFTITFIFCSENNMFRVEGVYSKGFGVKNIVDGTFIVDVVTFNNSIFYLSGTYSYVERKGKPLVVTKNRYKSINNN